ncbi:hypothetical protein PIB30_030495 [Stylosanthes scabra]|uniref:Uncharacterized protein n=1 Tax=Stylosanthes scabra TaxID=79078 RepID=A0ABU6WA39_9FABA|nr:hypothetical protein [Stylosanthes scabra]
MRVEQTSQFKDFFDRQNSFFEEMRTQTKAYKQGFEDLRVQQHKYVEEIKASQEITHKAVLELRENQNKHINDLAAHRKKYRKDHKDMKTAMEKSKAQFETANQYWHRINSKNEQKIDYLCWGIQQVNPYLKGRLPRTFLNGCEPIYKLGEGGFLMEQLQEEKLQLPEKTKEKARLKKVIMMNVGRKRHGKQETRILINESVRSVTNVSFIKQQSEKLGRTCTSVG